jgi:hypothetical protein
MNGDAMRGKVQMPIWLLTAIISSLIALFTYSITVASSYSETRTQVRVNTEVIKELKSNDSELSNGKIGREEFNDIKTQLNRIEGKLDTHISSTK